MGLQEVLSKGQELSTVGCSILPGAWEIEFCFISQVSMRVLRPRGWGEMGATADASDPQLSGVLWVLYQLWLCDCQAWSQRSSSPFNTNRWCG